MITSKGYSFRSSNAVAVEAMHALTGSQRDQLYTVPGTDEPKRPAVTEKLEDDYASELDHGRRYPTSTGGAMRGCWRGGVSMIGRSSVRCRMEI